VRTPERYIAAVDADEPGEAAAEELGPDRAASERLVLALRTRAGIKLEGPDADLPEMHDCIGALDEAGLVSRDGTHVVLTRRGRLLANEVGARLLGAHESATERMAEGAGERLRGDRISSSAVPTAGTR
jgi:coproporphyrinogen III oxidase-like Fe-S oxidoreductase